jgi:Amt family ammonium transporter
MAAGAVTIYSFVATAIIALVVNIFIKNRVTEEEELEGLDTAIHGESAYEFGPIGGSIGGHGTSTVLPKATVDA